MSTTDPAQDKPRRTRQRAPAQNGPKMPSEASLTRQLAALLSITNTAWTMTPWARLPQYAALSVEEIQALAAGLAKVLRENPTLYAQFVKVHKASVYLPLLEALAMIVVHRVMAFQLASAGISAGMNGAGPVDPATVMGLFGLMQEQTVNAGVDAEE